MSSVPLEALGVGKRLPALRLETAGRRPLSLRSSVQGRLATVVLLSHRGGCHECDDYARRLAAHVDWKNWDGRLVFLVPGIATGRVYAAGGTTAPTPIERWEEGSRAVAEASNGSALVDAARSDAADADRPQAVGEARLLIADRYGQIYHVERIDAAHDLPAPDAVEEWLRFLTTQCPECGAIDQPWT